MSKSLRRSLIATTTVMALTGFAALAAPPATPAAVPAPAPAEVIQAAAPGDHNMTGKVEQRITDLHTALKITAAQQPQWDAFAGAMRDNAKTMDQSFQHRVTGMAAMNAADNMQSYADISSAHAQAMQKMVPTFRALYSALSPEQKQAADAEFIENAHHGIDKPKG